MNEKLNQIWGGESSFLRKGGESFDGLLFYMKQNPKIYEHFKEFGEIFEIKFMLI